MQISLELETMMAALGIIDIVQLINLSGPFF